MFCPSADPMCQVCATLTEFAFGKLDNLPRNVTFYIGSKSRDNTVFHIHIHTCLRTSNIPKNTSSIAFWGFVVGKSWPRMCWFFRCQKVIAKDLRCFGGLFVRRQNSMTSVGLGNPYLKKALLDQAGVLLMSTVKYHENDENAMNQLGTCSCYVKPCWCVWISCILAGTNWVHTAVRCFAHQQPGKEPNLLAAWQPENVSELSQTASCGKPCIHFQSGMRCDHGYQHRFLYDRVLSVAAMGVQVRIGIKRILDPASKLWTLAYENISNSVVWTSVSDFHRTTSGSKLNPNLPYQS